MLSYVFFALCGALLFLIGLGAVVIQVHLVRKVIALNVSASGLFLLLIALAYRQPGYQPDSVPHSMVITGLVISVSATALLLGFILRLQQHTGHCELPDSTEE